MTLSDTSPSPTRHIGLEKAPIEASLEVRGHHESERRVISISYLYIYVHNVYIYIIISLHMYIIFHNNVLMLIECNVYIYIMYVFMCISISYIFIQIHTRHSYHCSEVPTPGISGPFFVQILCDRGPFFLGAHQWHTLRACQNSGLDIFLESENT